MHVSRLSLLLVATVLAMLPAGCGSATNGISSKTPTQIRASAIAVAQHAASVHVLANATTGPVKLSVNMRYARNGARGKLSIFDIEIEAVRLGDTLYAKGPTLDRRIEETFKTKIPPGTWIEGPASNGPLASVGRYTEMTTELPLILSRGTTTGKSTETSVRGQKTIPVELSGKLFTGALYVATTGRPYPIQLVKRGRETGLTSFTDWNKPVALVRPSPAVELRQLEHK